MSVVEQHFGALRRWEDHLAATVKLLVTVRWRIEFQLESVTIQLEKLKHFKPQEMIKLCVCPSVCLSVNPSSPPATYTCCPLNGFHVFLWSDVGCWQGDTGTEFRVDLTKSTFHCEFSLPQILLLNNLCVCYNSHTHTHTHAHIYK